jgi:saccharopine dehydrogenase-like NADP-dependent oxidoreductase
MRKEPFRILVVGSAGKLARFIIDEMVHAFGTESLIISDYKPERLQNTVQELEKRNGVRPVSRVIDIHSIQSIENGISNVAYVIVPASQIRPYIQIVCAEQGISCIDLSVSKKLIDFSFLLNKSATKSRCVLLMAAGLCPGLSGIIAAEIHRYDPSAIVDIGLLQSINAYADRTGIADMLEIINQKTEYFSESEKTSVKGFSRSKTFEFGETTGQRKLRLSNLIEKQYLLQRSQIRSNYWTAFDSNRMNAIIYIAKKLGILNIFRSKRFRLMAAGLFTKKFKNGKQEIIRLIGQNNGSKKYCYSFTSDYAATAACTLGFIKILEKRRIRPSGVYFPFELFEFEEVLPHLDHVMIKAD